MTLKNTETISGAILRVAATDQDAGHGQVAFWISGGNEAGIFRIDRSTGEIHVVRPSLLARSSVHQLNVTATDAAGLKSSIDAEVKITASSAGHRLAICDRPRYTFIVKENVAQNTVVGTIKDTGASNGK